MNDISDFDSFNENSKLLSKDNGILRDEDWLNWRLMECPFKKNIYFFEYKGNIAIVHIFFSNYIKRLNILHTMLNYIHSISIYI